MYQNAIITTDGSDVAASALKHAPQVVAPDGRIVVVEVVDSVGQVLAKTTPAGFELGGMVDAGLAEEIVAAQRGEAQKHLNAAKAALMAAGLKNVETVILDGTPGDRIVELASTRKSDVVIMSTHGRSGLRRVVLGSVADHVLRHLDNVAVLLVHPTE
ncbi:MAG: universal stress protein [Dehalococcoidia bacterium]|nr:universal stress protein [Dehalococcoidia bacterium]